MRVRERERVGVREGGSEGETTSLARSFLFFSRVKCTSAPNVRSVAIVDEDGVAFFANIATQTQASKLILATTSFERRTRSSVIVTFFSNGDHESDLRGFHPCTE